MKPTLLDIRRINALTDATFGVAMTILILSVEMPEGLTTALMHEMFNDHVLPSLFIYGLSFIILGSFWNESHSHNHLVFKSGLLGYECRRDETHQETTSDSCCRRDGGQSKGCHNEQRNRCHRY